MTCFSLLKSKSLAFARHSARPGTAALEPIGIRLPTLATPLPDRFIRHDHPADEPEFFHVAAVETEAEVQPDAVADEFGRETVIFVRIG
jgi:hypothetical protein